MTRHAALEALGHSRSSVAVSARIQALKDNNPDVRASAARALDKAGPIAVPALIHSLQDENEKVRVAAIDALGKIESSSTVPTLTAALDDPDEYVCSSAARILYNLKYNIQDIVNNLSNDAWQVRRNSADKLWLFSDNYHLELRSPLIKALKDPNPDVRASAAAPLVKIQLNIQLREKLT